MMRRLRIALFHNLPTGGAKRALYELVRRTTSRHDYTLYTIDLGCANRWADTRDRQDIPALARCRARRIDAGRRARAGFHHFGSLLPQPRTGRESQELNMLKFRTMRPGSSAPEWTREGDQRITPFGRILRQSHLDELPQVVNILRGQQSLVGPRPEQPHYVVELRDKIPLYDLRHLVRPGLTGWAQVKYPYGADELDALEKLQYDFYCLRHQSMVLDVRIVSWTIRTVVGRRGR